MSNIAIEDDLVPAIITLDMDEINKQVEQDPNLKQKMEDMVIWLTTEYNRLNDEGRVSKS
jgi:hypothetical protein